MLGKIVEMNRRRIVGMNRRWVNEEEIPSILRNGASKK